MNANQFRKAALSFAETEERSHMGHADFRVAGKIFATLGYPDKNSGTVKLSHEDQHYALRDHPNISVPVNGVWGRRGAANIRLKPATKGIGMKALEAAWRNIASKRIVAAEVSGRKPARGKSKSRG